MERKHIDPSLLETDDTDNVRNENYISSSVSFTDSAADLQIRSQMTKSDGTVRFMGRYWFRDPWRQSYLRPDD